MKIQEFDQVLLKDGREVVILEVFTSPPGYIVEQIGEDGETIDWFSIKPGEIEKVVYKAKSA